MFRVGLSQTLDLNASLNGGAADSGVTYEAAPGSAAVLTVNSSTGVVTPVAAGVGVVLVKDGTGAVVDRVTVSVLADAEMTVRDEKDAGSKRVAVGAEVVSVHTRTNSVFFDGSGDSLTAPSGSAVSGAGDFTVEAWIRTTALPSPYAVLYANDSSNGVSWGITLGGNVFFGRSLIDMAGTTSNSINLNEWNHVAISRTSGVVKIFINGVSGYSAAYSNNYSSGVVRIGADGGGSALPFTGHISSLRVVSGTGLYSSNFTPPKSLTNISGTKLLTCQQATLSDSSDNGFTITPHGNAHVVTSAV